MKDDLEGLEQILSVGRDLRRDPARLRAAREEFVRIVTRIAGTRDVSPEEARGLIVERVRLDRPEYTKLIEYLAENRAGSESVELGEEAMEADLPGDVGTGEDTPW